MIHMYYTLLLITATISSTQSAVQTPIFPYRIIHIPSYTNLHSKIHFYSVPDLIGDDLRFTNYDLRIVQVSQAKIDPRSSRGVKSYIVHVIGPF